MALKLFHRILISAAIGLGILLVTHAIVRYVARGDTSGLPTGIIGSMCSVGLAFYLRWFSRKELRNADQLGPSGRSSR